VKAVVLAGGKGTRLRPLTYTKPKPLLPLAGEPAIVRLVHKLAREGIDDVIVTTNYFAKLLRETLGDGPGFLGEFVVHPGRVFLGLAVAGQKNHR
jgi:mannose-1-phosphate guanylyltransferase